MPGVKGMRSGTIGKGRAFAFLREHVNYQGDDCLKWPFNTLKHTGYGMLQHERKMYYANRLMCELAHGPAPTPQHQSAHSCGNGHLGCVNPKHLSWKTRGENQRDRRRDGRANTSPWAAGRRSGKLTPAQVREIRANPEKLTQQKLADRYGVSRPTINHILNGKTWSEGHLAWRDAS